MKLSLSTHLFVFHPLDEAIVRLFPRFGFANAELWGMPPHFPAGDAAAGDALAALLSRHGVTAASVHSPLYPDVRSYRNDRWYSLCSEDEAHRLESVAATIRSADFLARHGGGVVVLHTSFPSEHVFPHRWRAFLDSLDALCAALPESVRFAVENTPGESTRTGKILELVERYPAERVGICLDLAHAHMQGSVLNAIRCAGPRLIHVHASDNHGVRDDHLVPGRGGIAWEPVVSALQEVGFDGMFTLELRDYTTGEDAPYGSFEEILTECGGMLDRLFGGSR
jgi:sugar phosphate isomerase/epimerase